LGSETPDRDDIPRDLSLGEAFGRSFDLVRKSYLKLLPIFAVFGLISALAGALITAATPALSLPQNVSSLTPSQDVAVMGNIVHVITFYAANFFVTTIILYLAAGIGVWQMFRILDQKQKLGFTFGNRLNFASLAIVTVIAVAIIEISGLIIVGPLILGTMFYLCLATTVAEGKSVLDAFGRSRGLISGKWGKTFVVVVGIQLIAYIAAGLISDIVGLFVSSPPIMSAVQNFILGLLFPLVSASMVVLYLSYRRGQEQIAQRPPSLYDSMNPQPMSGFANRSFCPACGASIASDEKFCHNCGAALSTQR